MRGRGEGGKEKDGKKRKLKLNWKWKVETRSWFYIRDWFRKTHLKLNNILVLYRGTTLRTISCQQGLFMPGIIQHVILEIHVIAW